MLHQPFYDPEKSYEKNYNDGPFGAFADGRAFEQLGEPTDTFFGFPVFKPFGIAAGPLLNGNFVKAALDKGFDLPVYKTVRTRAFPCHPWPNVVSVDVEGSLSIEQAQKGLTSKAGYTEPLSITNSFGVPSTDPEVWQKDLADAVTYAKSGQIVIGSFQGTKSGDGNVDAFVQDFVLGARMVKATGCKILEVNFSCPNEGTSHLLCFVPDMVRRITDAIKNEIGSTPLVMKVAYFEKDEDLKTLLEKSGSIVDGIAAINTIPAPVRKPDGKQALPGEGRLVSGVCGTAIQWAGLEMVKRLKSMRDELGLTYTIIGVGGCASKEDYQTYRLSGADAVMSATGAMWNPFLAQEIKQDIKYLAE